MEAILNINIKRILWYVLAGMKGGPTRVRILRLLLKRPYNMNQLGKELNLDYKTIQHHIKVLEENKLITSEEKKYGRIYFPSPLLEQNMNIFDEIAKSIKEEK